MNLQTMLLEALKEYPDPILGYCVTHGIGWKFNGGYPLTEPPKFDFGIYRACEWFDYKQLPDSLLLGSKKSERILLLNPDGSPIINHIFGGIDEWYSIRHTFGLTKEVKPGFYLLKDDYLEYSRSNAERWFLVKPKYKSPSKHDYCIVNTLISYPHSRPFFMNAFPNSVLVKTISDVAKIISKA